MSNCQGWWGCILQHRHCRKMRCFHGALSSIINWTWSILKSFRISYVNSRASSLLSWRSIYFFYMVVYFSRLKKIWYWYRLEYVESMVGNLLPLPSLQRLDWTMFHVLRSGWLVLVLQNFLYSFHNRKKKKILICIFSTGFQLLDSQLLKLPSERVNYFNTWLDCVQ